MSIHLLMRGQLDSSGGGGGSPTTIFLPSVTMASDDSNPNFSFRNLATLSGNLLTQVRATFRASNVTLNISGASFGKYSNAYPTQTTATPLPFLFSGSATASVSAGGSITSDWLNASSLSITSGQQAVVIIDTGASGGTKYSTGNSNVEAVYASGSTSGLANPGGVADSATGCWMLERIETQ